MIALALLAMAQPAPCALSDRWTVIENGGPLPLMRGFALAHNEISFKGGQAYWNGAPTKAETLRSYSKQVAQLNPTPTTMLRGYQVECALLQRYAALWEMASDCAPGMCIADFNPPVPRSLTLPAHRRKR